VIGIVQICSREIHCQLLLCQGLTCRWQPTDPLFNLAKALGNLRGLVGLPEIQGTQGSIYHHLFYRQQQHQDKSQPRREAQFAIRAQGRRLIRHLNLETGSMAWGSSPFQLLALLEHHTKPSQHEVQSGKNSYIEESIKDLNAPLLRIQLHRK
jgi:hypothetical protein